MKTSTKNPQSLLDLSAKIVAEHIPFQYIEQRYEHIPEPVQRRIIFWSFPRREDDIRMYSSLSSDTFCSSSSHVVTSTSSTTATTPSNNRSPIQNNNINSQLYYPEAQFNNSSQNSPTYNGNNVLISNNNTIASATSIKNGHNTSNKQLTFHKGLNLYNEGAVHDVLQIGFNLSGLVRIRTGSTVQTLKSRVRVQATGNNALQQNHYADVINNINGLLNNQNPTSSPSDQTNSSRDSSIIKDLRVSVTFDRCMITSVSCSCEFQEIFWCEHVVALILYRIRNPETIDLRVPISETLLSLDRQQLQKLVQYIIAEHHNEVLPTAQRLLDEMRQSYSEINQIQGAPDPTAGACSDDDHRWHLDEVQVNEKVQNYLSIIFENNSKDAVRNLIALFEKIREMLRAKDSNGIRLLVLITEQFLSHGTRNEKSRPLWDQLISLWVVVMLNPDATRYDRNKFFLQLKNWSRNAGCPREDVETRRPNYKRKMNDLSDDEDGDEDKYDDCTCSYGVYNNGNYNTNYNLSINQGNNYPAHMATHGRALQNGSGSFSCSRPYNPTPLMSSALLSSSASTAETSTSSQSSIYSAQLSSPNSSLSTKRSRYLHQYSVHHRHDDTNEHHQHNYHPHQQLNHRLQSSSNVPSFRRAIHDRPVTPANENIPVDSEPRSIFHRAMDFQNFSWRNRHLQQIIRKNGSNLFNNSRNPLWSESLSESAARVETLRSHGHWQQALRLTIATVRHVKLLQDQWRLTSDRGTEFSCFSKSYEPYNEGWIGHPMDPINILVDVLLDASLNEVGQTVSSSSCISSSTTLCINNTNAISSSSATSSMPNNRPIFPGLMDPTLNHVLPHFGFPPYSSTLNGSSYNMSSINHNNHIHILNHIPPLPIVNLAPKRPLGLSTSASQTSCIDKYTTSYQQVQASEPYQKETYLTLAFELALIGLGQQRQIPANATAHDRAVRQEAELISKLESIDISDPVLIRILDQQSSLLLKSRPTQNSCCGIPTDSSPLHTYARFLFDSLVPHYPQLAYKVGIHALCVPLILEENVENYGGARGMFRSSNFNHLQSEQLALAQTMLSKAKDEAQYNGSLSKVYKASVKYIRNPVNLLKLSKFALKEARPSGTTVYTSLLNTAFDLGLQVLKMTLSLHTSSNGRARRDAIAFIVDCANDIGLDAVLRVMREAQYHFSPIEALNLVVARDPEHANLRTQALNKLKLKDNTPGEKELNRECRELVLDCAKKDPPSCALEALKFCETDSDSFEKAIKNVIEAGQNGSMDSTQLIKVADYVYDLQRHHSRQKAFEIALVAVKNLTIPFNSDSNTSSRKDIMSACQYAQNVEGFKELIPILNRNIECAIILAEIYHRFCPKPQSNQGFRPSLGFGNEFIRMCKAVEMNDCWDSLLKQTLKAFVHTVDIRLQNISPRHYTEFVEYLTKAKGTFEKDPNGPQQFNDLIMGIMKSAKTKKKLIEKLKNKFEYPKIIPNGYLG